MQDEVDEEGAQDEHVAVPDRVQVATQAGVQEEAAGEEVAGDVSAVLERVRDRARSRWASGEEQNIAVRLVSWWLLLALQWRMATPV